MTRGAGRGLALVGIKRDQADVWFSKAVRLRDGCCVRCGTTETLQAMHIVGRRNKAVRWSLDNAAAGCAACHRYFTENPLAFTDFLTQLWGDGHLEILREKAREILKTTKELRKEISAHYRAEVRKKEEDPDHEIISYN
jgi:hypothetical protein